MSSFWLAVTAVWASGIATVTLGQTTAFNTAKIASIFALRFYR
jgi:hypothetical protein